MIQVERIDDVSIIRMCRKTANAINLEMVEALSGALQSATQDDSIAIVLTSDNDKFFAIGFDLPELLTLDRARFQTFYRRFNDLCLELFTAPKPVVAAMRGHSVAGGCILALCCDRRVTGEGRKLVGLNEVLLGLPVPYLSLLILRDLVGGRTARRIVETGTLFPSDEAMKFGIVDAVAPTENVEKEALAVAKELGSLPSRSFRALKNDRVDPVAETYRSARAEKEARFLDCWFSPDAKVELEKAAERFR